jgi:hypothetical protein
MDASRTFQVGDIVDAESPTGRRMGVGKVVATTRMNLPAWGDNEQVLYIAFLGGRQSTAWGMNCTPATEEQVAEWMLYDLSR